MCGTVVRPGPVRCGHGPPSHGEQHDVEDGGQRVPGVVHGRDGSHGVHGPIEAQPARVDEQSNVLDGQIEERQCPCDQAGRFSRRVVGGRKRGRTTFAHQRHPHEQETGRRSGQDGERPVHPAGNLQKKKNDKDEFKKIIIIRKPLIKKKNVIFFRSV